jgi:hypothetical protein
MCLIELIVVLAYSIFFICIFGNVVISISASLLSWLVTSDQPNLSDIAPLFPDPEPSTDGIAKQIVEDMHAWFIAQLNDAKDEQIEMVQEYMDSMRVSDLRREIMMMMHMYDHEVERLMGKDVRQQLKAPYEAMRAGIEGVLAKRTRVFDQRH